MPIYKGDIQIGKIFKGSTQIGKVYKGSTLIYQYTGCPNTFDYTRNTIYRYYTGSDIRNMPNGYTPATGSTTTWLYYDNIVNSTVYDREVFYYFLPITTYYFYNGNLTIKVYDVNCNLIADIGVPTKPYYTETISAGQTAEDRIIAITNNNTSDVDIIYFKTMNKLYINNYYGSYPASISLLSGVVEDWISVSSTAQTVYLNRNTDEITVIPVNSSTGAVTVKNTGTYTYLGITSYSAYSNTIQTSTTALAYGASTTVSLGGVTHGFIVARPYYSGGTVRSLTVNN